MKNSWKWKRPKWEKNSMKDWKFDTQLRKATQKYEVPVQKLAWAFLYISQSCLYLMGNIQNFWVCSISMGSCSVSSSLPWIALSAPFSRDPIWLRVQLRMSITQSLKVNGWGIEEIDQSKPYKNPLPPKNTMVEIGGQETRENNLRPSVFFFFLRAFFIGNWDIFGLFGGVYNRIEGSFECVIDSCSYLVSLVIW